MQKRKIIPILVLSLFLIISLGSVSANDNSLNIINNSLGTSDSSFNNFNNLNSDLNVVSIDINENNSIDVDSSNDVNNGNLAVNSNENSVDGNFSTLQKEVDNAIESKVIELSKNYTFNIGDNINGIKIQHDLTINGNGYTLNGAGLSSIFNISNGDVVLNDIIFTNADLNCILASNCNLILNNISFVDNYGRYDIELNGGKLTVYNSTSNRKTASILNNGGNITNLEIIILNNKTLGAINDKDFELFALVSVGGLKVHGEEFKFIINGSEVLGRNLEAFDYENNGYYTASYIINDDVNVNINYLGNSNPTIYSGNLKIASLLIPEDYKCSKNDTINVEVILDGFIEGKIEIYLLNCGQKSIDYVLTNISDVPDIDGKYHYFIPVNTSKYDYYDCSSIVASLVSNGGKLFSNPDKLVWFNKIYPVIDEINVTGTYGDIVDISVDIINGSVGDEVVLHIRNNAIESKVKNVTYLEGNQLKVVFSNVKLTNAGVYDTSLFYLIDDACLANTTVHWNVSKVNTKIIIDPSVLNGTVNHNYTIHVSVVDETVNHNLVCDGKINVSYFDKNGVSIENKTFDLIDGQLYLNLKYSESGVYSVKFNYLGGIEEHNTDNYNLSNASLIVNIKTSNVAIIINDPKSFDCEINETMIITGKVIDENGNVPKGNVTININGVDFIAIVNETGDFELKINSSVSGEWKDNIIHFISDNQSVWNNSDSDESNLVNITVSSLTPIITFDNSSVSGYINQSIEISGNVTDKYGNNLSGNVTININGVDFNASVDNGRFELYVSSDIAGNWTNIEFKYISDNTQIWNNASDNFASIVVNRLNTIILIDNNKIDMKVDETGFIEGTVKDSLYNLPASGIVYVTLRGITFNSTVDNNGNFKIPIGCNFSGIYSNIQVKFISGNDKVWDNSTFKYVKVCVNTLEITIVPDYNTGASFNFVYGEEGILNFTLYDEHNNTVRSGTEVILYLDEGPVVATVGLDGKLAVPTTINRVGLINYGMIFMGNEYYSMSYNTFDVYIDSVPTEMFVSANITGVLYESSNIINITVVNKNTKEPVTKGFIYFTLPDGTQFSRDLVNGEVIFTIDELNVTGNYVITISYVDYSGTYKYCSNSIMWNVTVPVNKVD